MAQTVSTTDGVQQRERKEEEENVFRMKWHDDDADKVMENCHPGKFF